MRLMAIDTPEPGSWRDKLSKHMKEKWADPEYRKKIIEGQKEKWANPVYRERILKAKQTPGVSESVKAKGTLGKHYDTRITELRRKIKRAQKAIVLLEFQRKALDNGGDPILTAKLFEMEFGHSKKKKR